MNEKRVRWQQLEGLCEAEGWGVPVIAGAAIRLDPPIGPLYVTVYSIDEGIGFIKGFKAGVRPSTSEAYAKARQTQPEAAQEAGTGDNVLHRLPDTDRPTTSASDR